MRKTKQRKQRRKKDTKVMITKKNMLQHSEAAQKRRAEIRNAQ